VDTNLKLRTSMWKSLRPIVFEGKEDKVCVFW